MYTIKDEYKHRIPELVDNFCSLKGNIPGLLEVESGGDELHSERSYDLILITIFESWDAFKAYQTHLAHLPVKKIMHEVRSGSVSVDYEMKG